MSDPLATYLQDHLAGAMAGIEILEALRDQHAGEPLGSFATEMLASQYERVEERRLLAARAALSKPQS